MTCYPDNRRARGLRAPWATLFLSLCLLGLCLLGPSSPARAAEGLSVKIMPQGQVPRLSQIVASFSSPMRPLGAMEQEAASSPLRVTPQPAGSYRWLDPQTLAFILDKPLSGSGRFTVSVAAGAQALDGSRLGAPVEAQISTPEVEVVEFQPEPDSTLPPQPELRIITNQPIDLASLAAHAFLEVGGKRLALKAAEQAEEQWRVNSNSNQLGRVYALQPEQDLPGGQKAQLILEPGLKPLEGQFPSQRTFLASYDTFHPLKLTHWEQRTSAPGKVDPAATITLEFNNPVSPQEVWRHLKITPETATPRKPGEDEEPTRWLYLSLGLKPRSQYQIRITPGLKDAYGTTLAQAASFGLKTGDMHPIFLLPGDKGVLESAGKGLYPFQARNLGKVRVAVQFIEGEQIVPTLIAEADRPWDKRPPRPRADKGAKLSELDLGLAPNQAVVHPLDLGALLGRSPVGGLTLLDLRADLPNDEGKVREQVQRTVAQVTDLGLCLKLGTGQGLVWVSRLASGEPLAGVDLELRDRRNRVIWQGQSDAQGLAKLPSLATLNPATDKERPWQGPQVFLLARYQGDLAVLPSTWSTDLVYSLPSGVEYLNPDQYSPLLAHAITQLPLYQPGQTVRLVVYLRKQDDQGLKAPAGQALTLEVKDPYGKLAGSFEGKANAYGSLAGELTLSPQARLGQYAITVKAGGHDIAAGEFRVASFRPPDFKVTLDTPEEAVQGQAQQASLEAAYLFGAPVHGGQAKIKVEQSESSYYPPRLEGYAVGPLPLPDQDTTSRLAAPLGTQEKTLDSLGKLRVDLPAPKPKPGVPMEVAVEATVADASGLTVSSRRTFVTHPASLYLGLKAPSLVQAGQPAQVEIKAATHDDQPAPASQIKVSAYREVWESVRERGPGGMYHHLSQPRRDKVWEKEASLPSQGAEIAFTPPQAGTYVILAEVTDQQGRHNLSGTYLFASGEGLAGWQPYDDNRLEVVAESSKLKPGQNAKLMIKNPFAKATALISVEGMGVRRVFLRQVEGPAPTVEVPMLAEDAPNAYLGVLLVRGRIADNLAGGPDLGKPQVRYGYAAVSVRPANAGLTVSVEPSQSDLRPGQELSAKVKVTSSAGQPRQAQVTFLAVDERVLTAASGRDNYDPRKTFLKPRPLTVLTADLRTQVLGQRFQGQKGDDSAGGGGLGQALRQDFHPAVHWLAQAQTDAQGNLETTFKLPDSLTAYRLVAVAAGQGDDFGLGKALVRASKPLQMLSALPRFAVAGDRFLAKVLVQNLGTSAGKVEVKVQAQGLELAGPASQSLELAPGQSLPVTFPVSATRAGEAQLTFQASLAGQEDAARFSLEVLPASQPQTAAMAGVLDPANGQGQAQVPLLMPAGSDPQRGGLSIMVTPSLAAYLRAPAQTLLDYPWDCLEQRLSRAAGRAMRLAHGPALGLTPAADDLAAIKTTLGQVGDFQQGDGGLAYWPGSRRADLFLTAYVVLAAQQIQATGATLDPEVKKHALDYLHKNLRRSPAPKDDDLSRRLAEALAIMALAQEGKPVKPLLEAAMPRAKTLPPLGLAALLRAAQLSQAPGLEQELTTLLEATAALTAQELHFATVDFGWLKRIMGSELRDNALVLWVLSQSSTPYPRLEGLASWVARRLGEDGHISTQEAVFGLWGLWAYLGKNPSQSAQIKLSLGGQELASQVFAQPTDPPLALEVGPGKLTPGQAQTLVLESQEGRPHWAARLTHAPLTPLSQPVNAGLLVARVLRPLGGQAGGPAVGDTLECLLTLVVSDTRHHVMISDPYPAGLEPLNAAQAQPSEDNDQDAPAWQPWTWKELRKTGLLLYAPRLDPGVYTFRYTLRATASGSFVHLPARAEEMYAPEVMGATAGGTLEVR